MLDMLDEFSNTKVDDSKPIPAKPTIPAEAAKDTSKPDDEFAEQLQAGMAELLGQFGSNPEMQQEFQKMMEELSGAAAQQGMASGLAADTTLPQPKTESASATKPKKTGDESFQDTIRKTMERMQTSGEAASAAATTADENDVLAQMLKQMENGSFPGLEGAGDEDFNKMLMGMMEHLTNKDILYEPMKDLHDKFPPWFEANKDKTKKEDLDRYEQQKTLVDEIVARFERPGYSDDNKEDRDYIVDKMQKVRDRLTPETSSFTDQSI